MKRTDLSNRGLAIRGLPLIDGNSLLFAQAGFMCPACVFQLMHL